MKAVGNNIHEVSEKGDSIAFLAYKYTLRAILRARPTPIETTNAAGSRILTISSMALLLQLNSYARYVAEEEFELGLPERDTPPSRAGPRPALGGRKGCCATLAAAAAADSVLCALLAPHAVLQTRCHLLPQHRAPSQVREKEDIADRCYCYRYSCHCCYCYQCCRCCCCR